MYNGARPLPYIDSCEIIYRCSSPLRFLNDRSFDQLLTVPSLIINRNVIPGHDDSPFVSFMRTGLEQLEVNMKAHCPVMPRGARYSMDDRWESADGTWLYDGVVGSHRFEWLDVPLGERLAKKSTGTERGDDHRKRWRATGT